MRQPSDKSGPTRRRPPLSERYKTARRRRLLLLGALLLLTPAVPLASHHIPDAASIPAPAPLIPELPLSFRPLTQAEALQSQLPLPRPCLPPDPSVKHAKHEQQPLPHRDQLAINLGTRLSAYFGTLHSHTNASDAEGTVTDAYQAARDLAHLDFFAVTDHPEYWLFDKVKPYADLRRIAAAAATPTFVPLYGFEYSSLIFGHYVVLNAPSVHHALEDWSYEGFYDWLRRPEQKDTLVMFAHPGFHDYRFPWEFGHFAFDAALREQFVAVETLHWSEYLRYWRGYGGKYPYIDEAATQGWWVGAAGSEDVHYANWGTRDATRIALLMPGLSEPNILAALRARHFYATSNRDLQFAVNLEKRDHTWAIMGDQVPVSALPSVATFKVRYYDGDCSEAPFRLEAVVAGSVVATYDFPPLKAGEPWPTAGEFTLALPFGPGAAPTRDTTHLPARFPVYFRFFQGDDHETYTQSSPFYLSF